MPNDPRPAKDASDSLPSPLPIPLTVKDGAAPTPPAVPAVRPPAAVPSPPSDAFPGTLPPAEAATAPKRWAPSATLGRYEVFGELGHGGMGQVLRGRDPELGRDLAIKVLLPKHQTNPALQQRFLEVARVGGQLQHPGVVPSTRSGGWTTTGPTSP